MRVLMRGIEGADFEPWTVWTDTHAARRLSELDMHRLFTKADWAKWRAAGEHDWGQQPITTEGGVNVYERDGEVSADDGQRTYGCCIGKGARSMSADGKAFAKARAKAEAKLASMFDDTLDAFSIGDTKPKGNGDNEQGAAGSDAAPGGAGAKGPGNDDAKGAAGAVSKRANARLTGRKRLKMKRKRELAEAVADMKEERVGKAHAKMSRKQRLKNLY